MELEVKKRKNQEQYQIKIKNDVVYPNKILIIKIGISEEDFYRILNRNNVQYTYDSKGKKYSYFSIEKEAQKTIDEIFGLLTMRKIMGE